MKTWHKRIYLLASGGALLGVLQGIGGINYNEVWFSFLTTILNALIALLFGGDPGEFV